MRTAVWAALARLAGAGCTFWEPFGEIVGESFEVLGQRCEFAGGNLLGGTETRLADTANARACAHLVRSTQPTATGATYRGGTTAECWAEFGEKTGQSNDDAVTPTFLSCEFSRIGAAAIGPRHVDGAGFGVGGSFVSASGEEWEVGQAVEIQLMMGSDGSGAGRADCAAAGGTYNVKSLEVINIDFVGQVLVTLDVISQGALEATCLVGGGCGTPRNDWCAVKGKTNVVEEDGEACHACKAGKEPGSGNMEGQCVDCRPGKWSSDVSTCYACKVGTRWGPLMSLGSSISTADEGCVFCEPGRFKTNGLKVVDMDGVDDPYPNVDASAVCVASAGRGWGGEQELVGAGVLSWGECAEMVLNNKEFANGVSWCETGTGRTVENMRTCTQGNCYAMMGMEGISTWQNEYTSCFIDMACQACAAGTESTRTASWFLGDGLGGTEEQLEDTPNATACAELVIATRPLANGASFASQRCYSESNPTAINTGTTGSQYVTTQFGSCDDATHKTKWECDAASQVWTADLVTETLEEDFYEGDAIGGVQTYVGTAESAQECAALVKASDSTTTGATYTQWADVAAAGSGRSNHACFAEYSMTHHLETTGWQTTFLLNTGCARCPAGKASLVAGEPCSECSGGTQPSNDSSTCELCAAGKYSTAADPTCQACPAGRISGAGATACDFCSFGSVPDQDQAGCSDCDQGKVAEEGDAACTACGAGTEPDDFDSYCQGCTTQDPDFFRSEAMATEQDGYRPCISCRTELGFKNMMPNEFVNAAADFFSTANRVDLPETEDDDYLPMGCECESDNSHGRYDYTLPSYYSMPNTWAAATGASADQATRLAFALPWLMEYSVSQGDETAPRVKANGWYVGAVTAPPEPEPEVDLDEVPPSFPIVIDRTDLTTTGSCDLQGEGLKTQALCEAAGQTWTPVSVGYHYRDHDPTDALEDTNLHNTYYLQCLTNGEQDVESKPYFATVIANSLKRPSEGGVAACVSCQSASECVTCCNEKTFSEAKKQEEEDCWLDMAMTGQTDCGYTDGWELPANCSAEETANNIAVPKKGWWRTGVESPLLHRCPVLDACLGGHETPCNVSAGFKADSVLCNACQPGFMKSSDGRCYACPAPGLSALMVGGTILIVILICIFLIRKNNKSVRLPTPEDVIRPGVTNAERVTIAFRILMAFIQLTRLMTSFVLPWPTFVESSVEAVAVVTEPSVMMMAFPCFAAASTDGDGSSFTITKALIIALSPAICMMLPCIWYGVAKLRARRKNEVVRAGDDTYSNFGDRTMAAIVCLIFVIYPSVVKSTFGLFTCTTLEEDLHVLRSDIGLRCFEGEHEQWLLPITIPSIVLWVIGIPLAAGLTMWYHRNEGFLFTRSKRKGADDDGEWMLYSLTVQRKFAFLYKGYEEPYYYWELVVLSRKMCFVVIDVLGEELGPVIQTVFALVVVSIALLLHIWCEPFVVAEVDRLERYSLTASMFTLIAGLFYYGRVENLQIEDGETKGIAKLCTAVVFLLNCGVILYFLNFVRQGARELRKEKKQKNAPDKEVVAFTPGSSGLPSEFTAKHEALNAVLKTLKNIDGQLDGINEKVPASFASDVDDVKQQISRLRGAVDYKERQADAVVRRHRWEAENAPQAAAGETGDGPTYAAEPIEVESMEPADEPVPGAVPLPAAGRRADGFVEP